ncbi:MAG: OsmC family protein [Thermodesulfovibrio sp.]|nr:OsmC family protein [Thermodesulfovibrio sp.]
MLTAKVKWAGDMQFVGQSGTGHAIVMDANVDFGGEDSGMRPMELLLIGLGGCSGMDIVSILKKKKQDIRDLEIKIKGQQADKYPKRFTEIEIEFIVKGKNLSEDAVKRAVELSMEKYCSVKATLEYSAKVTHSYKIENIE